MPARARMSGPAKTYRSSQMRKGPGHRRSLRRLGIQSVHKKLGLLPGRLVGAPFIWLHGHGGRVEFRGGIEMASDELHLSDGRCMPVVARLGRCADDGLDL